MRNFRRISALFISVFMLLVSLSGCSSNETADQIISRTSKLGTYSGKMSMDAELNMQGSNVICGMKSDMTVQTDPIFAKLHVLTSTNDPNIVGEFESDMYLKTEDGINTIYVGYNDEWYQQRVDSDDFKYSVSQYNPVDNAVLFMEAATGVTNVGTEQFNGYTANRYEGSIPKDLLCDLMQVTGTISMIGQNIDVSYYQNVKDQPITLWVNDEDGVIIGYELDLTELVNGLFTALNDKNGITDETQKLKAGSYLCEAVITDYNSEVDTSLPDNVANAPLIVDETANEGNSEE